MSTTTKSPQEIAVSLLVLAPVEIEEAIKNLSPYVAQEVERSLDYIAASAALFGAYISHRKGADGCGVKPVKDSVKYAMKRRSKIWRALGYNSASDFSGSMISGILERNPEAFEEDE